MRTPPAVLSLASGTLNQAVLLVTGILAARALGPEGRGTQALLALLPFVLSQVGTVGLPSAVVYFAGRPDVSSRSLVSALRRPVATQVVVSSAAQVVVLLLVARFHQLADARAALLTLLVLPAMIAQEYAVALLQARRRLVAFQVLRAAPNALYALGLVLVVGSWDDVELVDVMWCWLLAMTAGAVLTSAVARRGLTVEGRSADAGLVRDVQSFGRRSFLGAISPVEALRVDQLLAAVVLGPAALGLYVSASAFTGLTRTISQSVGVLAYTDVAHRHRTGPGRVAARRGAAYVGLATALTAVVAGAVLLTAPWLVTTAFGPSFAGAVDATRVLVLAGALLAVRRVAGDVARGTGRAAVNSWAEGATLASLVIAFIVVGSSGSPEAAAWAVLVAAAAGVLVLAVQVARPADRAGRRATGRHRARTSPPSLEELG